jgi:hypothetical protein
MYPRLIQFETRELELAGKLQLYEQDRVARARQAGTDAGQACPACSRPDRLRIRAALRSALGLT